MSVSEHFLLLANEKFIDTTLSWWQRTKIKLHNSILIDKNHPDTLQYFKSEIGILNEKKRHREHFPHTVHPLSKFHRFYELWCFFLYSVLIFSKTLDFGWAKISPEGMFDIEGSYYTLLVIITSLDILALLHVWTQFFIGYCVRDLRTIELSKYKIAKRCIVSGHFICDILSSIPRVLAYNANNAVYLTITTLTLLKLRRSTTCCKLIKPVARMFGVTSPTKIFVFGFCFIVFLVMHVATCFLEGITRYRAILDLDSEPVDEEEEYNYYDSFDITTKYIISFFKSSQYTLLISVEFIRKGVFIEEIIVSLLNYIVGKFLVITIWSLLVLTFFERRSLRVNSEQVMTQLNEFMEAKQVPEELKNKLTAYYNFKYRRMIINENVIRTVLSPHLKREVNVFLCQSLIKQVDLFAHLPTSAVKNIISHLIPEIFLPNELVIQSGTPGDCMYFIESGTVAVFTPSGKEICHLKDGAYFGEICLIYKHNRRTATVVSVEFVSVYKLNRQHFFRHIRRRDGGFKVMIEVADKRLRETSAKEDMYKKELFEQTFLQVS